MKLKANGNMHIQNNVKYCFEMEKCVQHKNIVAIKNGILSQKMCN